MQVIWRPFKRYAFAIVKPKHRGRCHIVMDGAVVYVKKQLLEFKDSAIPN
jgi:hypothetical protein